MAIEGCRPFSCHREARRAVAIRLRQSSVVPRLLRRRLAMTGWGGPLIVVWRVAVIEAEEAVGFALHGAGQELHAHGLDLAVAAGGGGEVFEQDARPVSRATTVSMARRASVSGWPPGLFCRLTTA